MHSKLVVVNLGYLPRSSLTARLALKIDVWKIQIPFGKVTCLVAFAVSFEECDMGGKTPNGFVGYKPPPLKGEPPTAQPCKALKPNQLTQSVADIFIGFRGNPFTRFMVYPNFPIDLAGLCYSHVPLNHHYKQRNPPLKNT